MKLARYIRVAAILFQQQETEEMETWHTICVDSATRHFLKFRSRHLWAEEEFADSVLRPGHKTESNPNSFEQKGGNKAIIDSLPETL